MLRATEALARQTRADRAAQFVAALVALRNNERQAALFQDVILPKVRETSESLDRAYPVGASSFADVVEGRRAILAARLLIAEARMAREKRLVELEALAGVDVETLGRPESPPAPGPRPVK